MKQQFWNSPFTKATILPAAQVMMPCSHTQTTRNLQVIKLLQAYIWCEHIQYSNDLKVRQDGEKKNHTD